MHQESRKEVGVGALWPDEVFPFNQQKENKDKTELSKDFESPASCPGISLHMAKGVPLERGPHGRSYTWPGKLGGIQ